MPDGRLPRTEKNAAESPDVLARLECERDLRWNTRFDVAHQSPLYRLLTEAITEIENLRRDVASWENDSIERDE